MVATTAATISRCYVYDTRRTGVSFYVSLAENEHDALLEAAQAAARSAGSGTLLIKQVHGGNTASSLWMCDLLHVWQVGCRNVFVKRALLVANCLSDQYAIPAMAIGIAADELWQRDGPCCNMQGPRSIYALSSRHSARFG